MGWVKKQNKNREMWVQQHHFTYNNVELYG